MVETAQERPRLLYAKFAPRIRTDHTCISNVCATSLRQELLCTAQTTVTTRQASSIKEEHSAVESSLTGRFGTDLLLPCNLDKKRIFLDRSPFPNFGLPNAE